MEPEEIGSKFLNALYDLYYSTNSFDYHDTKKIIQEIFQNEVVESQIYAQLDYMIQKRWVEGIMTAGSTVPLSVKITLSGINIVERDDNSRKIYHNRIRASILKFLKDKYFSGQKDSFYPPEKIFEELQLKEIPKNVFYQEFNVLKEKAEIIGDMALGKSYPIRVKISAHGIDAIDQYQRSFDEHQVNEKKEKSGIGKKVLKTLTTGFIGDSQTDDEFDEIEPIPNSVFVLMAMGEFDGDEIHKVIKSECKTLGLKAKRVDELSGSYPITDDIIMQIEESEFIIADLTYERPNVYYELGYAHGVGNEGSNILLIAKEGTKLHFDLAHLQVRFYRSPEHLREIIKREMKKLIDERDDEFRN